MVMASCHFGSKNAAVVRSVTALVVLLAALSAVELSPVMSSTGWREWRSRRRQYHRLKNHGITNDTYLTTTTTTEVDTRAHRSAFSNDSITLLRSSFLEETVSVQDNTTTKLISLPQTVVCATHLCLLTVFAASSKHFCFRLFAN